MSVLSEPDGAAFGPSEILAVAVEPSESIVEAEILFVIAEVAAPTEANFEAQVLFTTAETIAQTEPNAERESCPQRRQRSRRAGPTSRRGLLRDGGRGSVGRTRARSRRGDRGALGARVCGRPSRTRGDLSTPVEDGTSPAVILRGSFPCATMPPQIGRSWVGYVESAKMHSTRCVGGMMFE